MNNNKANSTAFKTGNFITLSKPPVLQPSFFTAVNHSKSIILKWTNAMFPKKGASKAGYLLIYASKPPLLKEQINGKPPEEVIKQGDIIHLSDVQLPQLPDTTATLHIREDGIYNFLIVPYTWNGEDVETYNYLTTGALTNKIVINEPEDAASIAITPNPSNAGFNLKLPGAEPTEKVSVRVINMYGRQMYFSTQNDSNIYSFGNSFPSGTYIVNVIMKNSVQNIRIVKLK